MTIDEVYQTLKNGKQLIANIVGGSYQSSFATLANNAQNIKNQRDQYYSQLSSRFGRAYGSITSNTFKAQISYPFKYQMLLVSSSTSYQHIYIFNKSGFLSRRTIESGSCSYTSFSGSPSTGNEWSIYETYYTLIIRPANGNSYCEIELVNKYSSNILYYTLFN
jgi:hypothetical protein